MTMAEGLLRRERMRRMLKVLFASVAALIFVGCASSKKASSVSASSSDGRGESRTRTEIRYTHGYYDYPYSRHHHHHHYSYRPAARVPSVSLGL